MSFKSSMKRFAAVTLSISMLSAATACTDRSTDASGVSSDSASVSSTADRVVSDGTARVYIENGEFKVNGENIWFSGTNTPWDNWDDFGREFDASFWDSHFADLHEAGINSSRVWILCSGDYGIQFDANNHVTGMTDQFWADVDSLMEIAAKHKIYIMATMMSFDCCKEGNKNYKRFRHIINDEPALQSYIDNYILPFAKRYDSNDYLYSIDICNEPDWINENQECGKIDVQPLVNFYAKVSAAIHQNSDILVTTGIAIIRNNSDKHKLNWVGDAAMKQYGGDDACMDFYSVHFYDWMLQWYGNPFVMTPEQYGLDTSKPNVMGECSALGSQKENMDLCQAAQSLYDNGWDGVFPWTSNGSDANGGFNEVSAYGKQMLAQIPELIFPMEH